MEGFTDNERGVPPEGDPTSNNEKLFRQVCSLAKIIHDIYKENPERVGPETAEVLWQENIGPSPIMTGEEVGRIRETRSWIKINPDSSAQIRFDGVEYEASNSPDEMDQFLDYVSREGNTVFARREESFLLVPGGDFEESKAYGRAYYENFDPITNVTTRSEEPNTLILSDSPELTKILNHYRFQMLKDIRRILSQQETEPDNQEGYVPTVSSQTKKALLQFILEEIEHNFSNNELVKPSVGFLILASVGEDEKTYFPLVEISKAVTRREQLGKITIERTKFLLDMSENPLGLGDILPGSVNKDVDKVEYAQSIIFRLSDWQAAQTARGEALFWKRFDKFFSQLRTKALLNKGFLSMRTQTGSIERNLGKYRYYFAEKIDEKEAGRVTTNSHFGNPNNPSFDELEFMLSFAI